MGIPMGRDPAGLTQAQREEMQGWEEMGQALREEEAQHTASAAWAADAAAAAGDAAIRRMAAEPTAPTPQQIERNVRAKGR